MRDSSPYVGRFAPSPTGELHFGSLIAAVASFLQARARHGQWLVRIEDIDPPRELKGSAESILADLTRLGMKPDQPVLYQGTRIPHYREARDLLVQTGLAFWCSCSRKSLPPDGIYPGTCRNGAIVGADRLSTRIRVKDEVIEFNDGLQGRQTENLAKSCGDFVIWRSDDLPAYQLAVVIDDAYQGITEIVRGSDLLDSTARQIHLQRALGLQTPAYIHLPVATVDGKKLGKRIGSDPVGAQSPSSSVRSALEFLGHRPPERMGLENLWAWAIEYWDVTRVPATMEIGLD